MEEKHGEDEEERQGEAWGLGELLFDEYEEARKAWELRGGGETRVTGNSN